jgi:hypothetical protein
VVVFEGGSCRRKSSKTYFRSVIIPAMTSSRNGNHLHLSPSSSPLPSCYRTSITIQYGGGPANRSRESVCRRLCRWLLNPCRSSPNISLQRLYHPSLSRNSADGPLHDNRSRLKKMKSETHLRHDDEFLLRKRFLIKRSTLSYPIQQYHLLLNGRCDASSDCLSGTGSDVESGRPTTQSPRIRVLTCNGATKKNRQQVNGSACPLFEWPELVRLPKEGQSKHWMEWKMVQQ